MAAKALRISIVVPCFCEEEALPVTIPVLTGFLDGCIQSGLATADSEIVFVDDGSVDHTWDLILAAHNESPLVKGVCLSGNCGHQNALLAGLEAAKGEFTISIDADLQDDVSVMRDMILDAQKGIDIVYGVRKKRETDTFFKRATAEGFYKLMSFFGVDLVFNHADFRGMSKRALCALLKYRERELFLRGLVRKLGFRTSKVYYDRQNRQAGTSKYPFAKMLKFAINGITSFSFVPLRFVTLLGLSIFGLSLVLFLWIFYVKFISQDFVAGWASQLAIVTIFGGIQLLCIGILGEYMAVIFMEVKNRPRFHILETTDVNAPTDS